MVRISRVMGLTAALVAPVAFAQSFSPPSPLSAAAQTDAGADYQPTIVGDEGSTWLAAWVSNDGGGGLGLDEDILFARSVDGGSTWSAAAALATDAATDVRIENGPQLATDGLGTWVAAWFGVGGPTGPDGDLFVAHSTDDGVTWTSPVPLNVNAATDAGDDFQVRLATDGAGTWIAVWYSDDTLGATVEGDNDILIARSTDDGATWTFPVALNDTAPGDSTEDTNPVVVTDRSGTWVVAWEAQDATGGPLGFDVDVLTARSTDGGLTWTSPAALNATAATDTAHDFSIDLATDRAGTWLAVWRSEDPFGGPYGIDADVFAARSTDGGATWTSPLPVNNDAAFDSAIGMTFGDHDPRIVTDGLGSWLAVWVRGGPDEDVFVARSTDDGGTWTNPVPLHTNAARDAGADVGPAVATDRSGRWVAVWQSSEDLEKAIGTDWDVLVATGETLPLLGVDGTKLVVVDRSSAGGAKTVFVSRDRAGRIAKGTGTYDHGFDLELDVAYANGAAQGTVLVPLGAWDGTAGWITSTDVRAKFANRLAPSGVSQAKVVGLKPTTFKLVARGLGDVPFDVLGAGPPTPEAVGTVVTRYCVNNEGERRCYCSAFPACAYRSLAGGAGAKLVCKDGGPDVGCAAAGAP